MDDRNLAPIVGGEKEAVWPKWNGSSASFPLYFARLKIKIAADFKKLGGNEIICHSILETKLESKQQRVSHWFLSGGPNGGWDVKLFLSFLKDKFNDKLALQTAGSELQRMRMGDSQDFELFLDDLELKLAQCSGLKWPDEDKIIRINEAINTKLTDALIGVDLLDNDYDRWISRVRKNVSRLESRPGYITDSQTSTLYLSKQATAKHVPHVSRCQPETSQPNVSPLLDADGDVQMSGLNLVALINALIGRTNSGTSLNEPLDRRRQGEGSLNAGIKKPRAKWLSRSEANQLIAEGSCLRCRKTGHIGKKLSNLRTGNSAGSKPYIY